MDNQASSAATTALILGLASWVLGPLILAIPAIIIGKQELAKIDAGQSPEAGRSFATIGMIAGIVNVVGAVVGLAIACCIWGGFMTLFMGAAAAQ